MTKSSAFLLLIFSSLSASISGLKVNPSLETSITCNSTEDCFQHSESLAISQCNLEGKCQCPWQYYPTSSTGEGTNYDQCSLKRCSLQSTCLELYEDQNATCNQEAGLCDCQDYFEFNQETGQCEYYDPEVLKLGANCTGSQNCGSNSRCTTNGYCQCDIGFLPANSISCRKADCDSDEYCRVVVTPNSRCFMPGTEFSQCRCTNDFTPDYFTQQCVQTYRKIGQTCNHTLYPFFCGAGAWCISGHCKCPIDKILDQFSMNCVDNECQMDSDCHGTDANTVCKDRKCECAYGFRYDVNTVSCSWNYNSALLRLILKLLVLVCLVTILKKWIDKSEKQNNQTKNPSLPDAVMSEKPPRYPGNPVIFAGNPPSYSEKPPLN